MADGVFLAQVFGFDDDVRHSLNHIRKGLFHLPELADAQPEEEGDHDQTEGETRPIDGAGPAQDAPPEAVDDAHHRIQAVEQSPLFRDDAAAKAHRRNVQAELNHKGNDVAKVPVLDIERCYPEAGS